MALLNQQLTNATVHGPNGSVHDENGCSGPVMDVDEAAGYLGMSAKWVYRNLAILPVVRFGHGRKPRIKFPRCDLDAWIREHRIAR